MADQNGNASTACSGEVLQQIAPGPGTEGKIRLGDRVLRHHRLLPTLVDVASDAWRRDPLRRGFRRQWATHMIVLTDRPYYDGAIWVDDHEVIDGDVEAALTASIAATCAMMTPTPPDDRYYDPDHPEPMEYDAALAFRGRILAAVRHSPNGPTVTRLDQCETVPADESLDGTDPVPGTAGGACFRRTSWISTPQTRATASRLVRRGRDRFDTWMTSVTALMDRPDEYSDCLLPALEFADGGLPDALDAAITMACEAMLPPSQDRACLDPGRPEPLRYDVALAVCGRIYAIVQNAEPSAIVTVFTDTMDMVDRRLTFEEAAPI
jgi:hypothetical protein